MRRGPVGAGVAVQVALQVALQGCSLLVAFDRAAVSRAPEICDNQVDDDEDGDLDCQDASCEGDPICQESSAAACADGNDNDEDGRIDCADAGCAARLSCIAGARLERDRDCPARTGASLHADIASQLDRDRWTVAVSDGSNVGTSSAGHPLTAGPGVTVALSTRDRFTVGLEHPFTLTLRVRQRGGGGELGQASLSAVFREAGGEQAFALDVHLTDHGAFAPRDQAVDLTVSCAYGRRARTTGTRRIGRGDPIELHAALDPGDHAIHATTGGAELCATGPLAQGDDVESVLAISGYRTSTRDPGLVLEAVGLDVSYDSERCRGLREPLLAPGFCDVLAQDGLRLRRQAAPLFVGRPGRYLLLAPASWTREGVSRDGFVWFASSDGRHGWAPLSPAAPLVRGLGAKVHAAALDRGEILLLGTCRGCTDEVQLFAAPDDDPGAFAPRGGAVTLDGAPAPTGFPLTFFAGEDGLHAWYQDGGAFRHARSGDGAAWVREAGAELPSALGRAAAASNREVTILAYGFAGGLGLSATSPLPSRWSALAANPVFAGADPGLDDATVTPLGVELTGGMIRLWYAGESSRSPVACASGAPTSDGAGVALAELHFRDAP